MWRRMCVAVCAGDWPATDGRGCHREAGRRAAPGLGVSEGICGTECAISVDNRGGDIGFRSTCCNNIGKDKLISK